MSLKKGLRELWEDLMSYRTLKVVKISDQRLAYVHKTLMASILVYSAISMVGSHTYMLKEKPRMYVATTVDDSLRLSNFSTATAAYCDVANTDFAGDTFVAEGAYLNNQCAEHFATSQLTRLTDAGAFVATHVQTQDWTRTCEDDTELTGCVLTDDGDAKNYFPADVDAIALQFRPTYVTSWGVSEPPTTIFAMDVDGEEVDYFYVYDDLPEKRTPKFTIADLLSLGNTSLADTNPVYVSSNFTGTLPSYRLTGLRLNLDFTFSNFRPMAEGRPFHFEPQAKMSVKVTSEGSFVGAGADMYYTGAHGSFDASGTRVEMRGVKIEFQSKGLMGVADGYTGMMALMSCLVMVGVATAIVDVIGAFIYDSFKDDKIEDDGERQHLEHMILNIETSGVPFKHDDLQVMPNVSVKDFLQMLQKDILKLSTLAHHMSRDLSQAGLNRHTMDIASMDVSANEAARFHCALVGPDRSEVYLTGGPQTVGRGHGGSHSKRISHKQLSVVANTHTGVAIVRGMRTKNCSGVALGGGPWQALGMDDEVELMNGDMVALLMDEGADEDETTVEGVFVYRVTLVENKKPPSAGFWPFW
jgi:hypothetical protein|uniref:Uncharacterized protein n=1 Tax=Micromonas pusilla TaxID=38833 RepID=A0A7S0D4B0_MICPS|mmetsp:Transcript_3439/g.14479  ORF Transcript_3439/g.14479 Transcript_3439/m.14479 type:complete len:585 (+) Transcript_3439:100-1854(+)